LLLTGNEGIKLDMSHLDLKRAFFEVLRQHEFASPLREAALSEDLAAWTKHLTAATIRTCEEMSWKAASKGRRLQFLPEARNEYLTIDVMAFSSSPTLTRWPFPIAAFELENSKNSDRIAYSFWKHLCLRVPLRVLFCYRHDSSEGNAVLRFLQQEVLSSLNGSPEGETLVVVGSRSESSAFPYGFFRWWQLNPSTTSFNVI
jgi:hypothetical protein